MASGSLDFRLNLLANTAGLQQGMNVAKFAVNALVAAMAAVGVGLSVQGLAQATDSYTNLSARINIATKDGGNFNQAMAGVHQVALATNSNLTTTADLFTRLNAVGKDMGITQQQALDLTKTVTQAIKIGGGSAEAADGAVTQFIQAMQGGVLRGEEFNSIMEGGYGLAEALAKGLGVTTGELRKMAEAGELSSDRVVKALQSQSASVQASDKTNGLTKFLQALNVAIGFIDDGFNGLKIGASLLAGVIYDVAAAFTYWKSKLLFGEYKDAALKEYEELSLKAKSYYEQSSTQAMEFKSKGVEALNEINKTQKEKDADTVAFHSLILL